MNFRNIIKGEADPLNHEIFTFAGTHPSHRGIKKQEENLKFLGHSSSFMHFISIS